MYVYIYNYIIIYTYRWKKCDLPINVHCMHIWMDVCIEKSQINRVLNKICTVWDVSLQDCGRIPWGT